MSFLDLFKRPVVQPLPVFEQIELKDIPKASAILFYGGNKLTELAGNRLYKHLYTPPAFHAAFYIGQGLILNVGKFKELVELEKEFRSTRRVDVIVYDIPVEVREKLERIALLDTSKNKMGLQLTDYAINDYLRFGLKFLKPSKKDFCSENVCEVFATQGIKVSDEKPVDTAPWTLLEYALKNSCKIYTLHIGSEFK